MKGQAVRHRRGKGKGKGKSKAYRKRRNYNVPEKASCTEVVNTSGVLATNTNYSNYNAALNQLPRAAAIAKGYQFYRIKRITMVIKPTQDTFTAGSSSIPYLYYMIDRTKQFVNGFSINQLKAMGAKARRLDEKTLTFSYTPSVLLQTYDNTVGAETAVKYEMSPWLPTKDAKQAGVWNPNTTDHLGIVWRVEQAIGPTSGFTLERRIEVEFKKPAITTEPTLPEDVPTEIDVDPVV